VEEFTYLGDASKRRPSRFDDKSMEEWFDYVYIRDNIKGRMKEYWHHGGGCRSWLVVDRDTETHEIFGVTTARDYARRGKI
jgi:sarcosine oxidase subunit delta